MTTTLKSSRRLAGRWGACGTGVPPVRGMGVPPMEPKAATALERTARMAVPRRGYSLAELVLALGVLGIGMTMAAALFPAAIKLNELSTRDSIGTIVATNGLAIAQAVIHPGIGSGQFDSTKPDLRLVDESECQAFGDPNLLLYRPDPNTPPTRGCLVLARPLNGTYQLVIVSYDKYSANNEVKARNVTFSVVEGETAVQVNDTDAAQSVGAPLIYIPAPPNDHAIVYARITGYDPKTGRATLDHAIDSTLADWDAFLIVEESGAMVLKKSPVMTVLVAETTLKSGP